MPCMYFTTNLAACMSIICRVSNGLMPKEALPISLVTQLHRNACIEFNRSPKYDIVRLPEIYELLGKNTEPTIDIFGIRYFSIFEIPTSASVSPLQNIAVSVRFFGIPIQH